jgi:hypothetical protein
MKKTNMVACGLHKKLRLERVNNYYKGKRDKKSKDTGNKEN